MEYATNKKTVCIAAFAVLVALAAYFIFKGRRICREEESSGSCKEDV